MTHDLLAKEDPDALKTAIKILEDHPHYHSKWKKSLSPGLSKAQRGRRLFALAARWPDDIRKVPKYNRSKWHYINNPVSEDSMVTPAPSDENIIEGYRRSLAEFKSANATSAEKAIAICWLLHLVGDAHQPLHAANWYSAKEFPKGDRGGTNFHIRPRPNRATTNLHKYWDDVVIGNDSYGKLRRKSVWLLKHKDLQPGDLSELSEKRFEGWLGESLKLARTKAYLKILKGRNWNNRHKAKAVPKWYRRKARNVANRRMTLAAYRLSVIFSSQL